MPCPNCQHHREAAIDNEAAYNTEVANHYNTRAMAARIASALDSLSRVHDWRLPDDIKHDIKRALEDA